MAGNNWTVREADSFELGAAQCGGLHVVEEHIAVIKLGLSKNPKEFLLTQLLNIYVAKTDLHWRGSEIVMAYNLWFRVDDDARTVDLLWIEWRNPGPEDWGDDVDYIPF